MSTTYIANRDFRLAVFNRAFEAGDPIHAQMSEEDTEGLPQAQIDKLIRQGLIRDAKTKPAAKIAEQPKAPAGVKPGSSKGKNAAPKLEDIADDLED